MNKIRLPKCTSMPGHPAEIISKWPDEDPDMKIYLDNGLTLKPHEVGYFITKDQAEKILGALIDADDLLLHNAGGLVRQAILIMTGEKK